MTGPRIQQHAPLRGTERDAVRADVVKRYKAGASIRTVAGDIERSYTFVHHLLTEAGVELRSQGGGHNRTAATR
jgi:hypothetical protein